MAWVSVDEALPHIAEEVVVRRTDGRITALARFIPYEGAIEYWWDNKYPGTGNMVLSRGIFQ